MEDRRLVCKTIDNMLGGVQIPSMSQRGQWPPSDSLLAYWILLLYLLLELPDKNNG